MAIDRKFGGQAAIGLTRVVGYAPDDGAQLGREVLGRAGEAPLNSDPLKDPGSPERRTPTGSSSPKDEYGALFGVSRHVG